MKAPISNANFGKTAADYLTHRRGFPKSLFQRLEGRGLLTAGLTIVDLGTGTGSLARGLALPGNQVTGIDPSIEMLEAARTLNTGGCDVTYHEGTAEATGLPDHSVDMVAAGQCWHWFDSQAACREVRRILKPGGTVLVAYYDWIPLPGNVARCSEEMIETVNPAWKGGNGMGIHPRLFGELSIGGFSALESFTYDEAATYSHEGWRGRIRASAGISATLSAEAVAQFDADHARMLASRFPEDPLLVPHRIFVLHGRLN